MRDSCIIFFIMDSVSFLLASPYSPGGFIQNLASTYCINEIIEKQASTIFTRFSLNEDQLEKYPYSLHLVEKRTRTLSNSIVIGSMSLIIPIWVYSQSVFLVCALGLVAIAVLALTLLTVIEVVRRTPSLGEVYAKNRILYTAFRRAEQKVQLSSFLQQAYEALIGERIQAPDLRSAFDKANLQDTATRLLSGSTDAKNFLEESDPGIYRYYIIKLIFLYSAGELHESDGLPQIEQGRLFTQKTEDFILSIRSRLKRNEIEESQLKECANLFNGCEINHQAIPDFFRKGLDEVVYLEIRASHNVIPFLQWAITQ
mgnify:CR=1 FL=1